MEKVLLDGQWREANASGGFRAENPTAKSPLPAEYPVSTWADCDAALSAAAHEAERLLPDLKIEEQTWRRAIAYWTDQQQSDGSWGYIKGSNVGAFGQPTGSMSWLEISMSGVAACLSDSRSRRR